MRERLSMSDETATKTCDFDVCCRCKLGCCQDVKPPLTLKRQEIIDAYLKTQNMRVQNCYTHGQYSFPSVDELGFCVFYNKKTRNCLVHSVKPETCRAGPVTFDINLPTGKVEWYLKKSEVCTFANILYGNGDLFKEHFKAAREEIMRLICELDSEALQTILKIEEPQTFKIGEDDLPSGVMEKLGREQRSRLRPTTG
jgi:Fe-S-cluster containining protein